MTVNTGEFDTAVNSLNKYADPAKTDFAQLLGVQNSVSF